MNTEKWVYMIGDEHTSDFFKTKDDAIVAGLSVYGEDEWHYENDLTVGIFVPYKPSINVEGLIDRRQDSVYDDYSECRGSDTYLENVTEEQSSELENELNKVLQTWIQKHDLEANFGNVYKVEVIDTSSITHQ